jgi:2-keto-4-pentenoate hydratase/2-oxohepta-3-ene-1,7-dioic acid hydratase in catechol pathway
LGNLSEIAEWITRGVDHVAALAVHIAGEDRALLKQGAGMRIGVIDGRAFLTTADGAGIDIADASGGRFGPDPMAIYEEWAAFESHAGILVGGGGHATAISPDDGRWGIPVPRPRQVFAVGMNYAEHAQEAGVAEPAEPAVFTKFVTSLTGPFGEVALPAGNVDWEVELVAVIGRGGRHVAVEKAWSHVAGLTVGQDLSERVLQRVGPVPQFSLAKSHAGFGPVGPFVVTPDEFADPDDLELGCKINGDYVQRSRTSKMIFSVPVLVAKLSAVTELLPGDLIFTGTPSGVGVARTPPRFLGAGDELVSYVEEIGQMRQTFVDAVSGG